MHCQFILFVDREMNGIEAYFCHHLSDNYVHSSDLYGVCWDLYVDLSDLYYDLSLTYLLKNKSEKRFLTQLISYR